MKTILLAVDGPFLNNEVFNLNNKILNRDNSLQPFYALREELSKYNYNIQTIDKGNPLLSECIIFFDTHISTRYFESNYFKYCIKNRLQDKMVLFLWEPPVVAEEDYGPQILENFKIIFTWNDELVDNKKYFKLYYPQPDYDKSMKILNFKDKKFCTLIAANKMSSHQDELYSERINAIRFFEKSSPADFDLYGFGWNEKRINTRLYTNSRLNRYIRIFRLLWKDIKFPAVSFYPSYRGSIKDKIEILSQYKFCICYENMCNVKGYITEKIFDCFKARCIPIYLGTDNVTDFIPENTFIDKRKFSTYDSLLSYLRNISESEYNEYIENIGGFLKSEKYYPFSIKGFANNVITTLLKRSYTKCCDDGRNFSDLRA